MRAGRELTALARRKELLTARIAVRRLECALQAEQVAARVDAAKNICSQLSCIAQLGKLGATESGSAVSRH